MVSVSSSIQVIPIQDSELIGMYGVNEENVIISFSLTATKRTFCASKILKNNLKS